MGCSKGKRGVTVFMLILLLTGSALLSAEPAAPKESKPVVARLSADGVQRAEIIVDNYSYTPDYIVVTVNRTVELTLKSVAWLVPHNFILETSEASVGVKRNVPAGHTVVVQFTPAHTGRFKFICDKKLLFFKSHEEKGMVGTIEVRETTP